MGYNNGIITTTGISIADVSAVLGAASCDVGTLCRHSNINMWSRHKPVSFNKLAMLKNVGEEAGVQVDEWKGDDRVNKPYGISLPVASSDIRQLYGSKISYNNRPKGGATSPYRLSDFSGYNHNAICPWRLRFPEGEMYKNQNNVLIHFYDAPNIPEGNLLVTDIMDGNRRYVAVGVWNSASNSNIPAEMKTFSADSPSISLEGCSLLNNVTSKIELTMVAAFTNKPISEWTNVAEQTFYAMDCDEMPAVGHIIVKPIEYVSTYNIAITFTKKNGSRENCIIMRSEEQKPTDGRIYGVGEWRSKPTAYYIINSITVNAYKVDDRSVLLGTGTITNVSGVIPNEISSTDYVDTNGSGSLQFRCDINNSVAYNGVAYFRYTFNYKEI